MNGLGLTSYKFNIFPTVVLIFNLLETVKRNKYIRSQVFFPGATTTSGVVFYSPLAGFSLLACEVS